MASPRPRYVSVDVETSGPVPGEFSMLSVGAVDLEDRSNTFYAELKPITDRYDEKALSIAMPGRTHASLYETGMDAAEAMQHFADWVDALTDGGSRRPVFVAHNAPFDWMFVAWYFWKFVGRNPFGWDALDTRALFMGMTGAEWTKTRLEHIKAHFPTKGRHHHHALEDALEQGDLFLRMLEVLSGRPDPGETRAQGKKDQAK
ncbi:MAG: 3'-5' exonuclease [Deltaproteobacteria bacterium]|nr:MAG: 3'-5' exonuclease [Deltaproteobacteria bacterium]